MIIALLLACEPSSIQTTGEATSFDVQCGPDLWTAMGHVDQRTALNMSICWLEADGDEVCDMTPAPGTIVHRPVTGFVADSPDYGPDASLRISYLLTPSQNI